MKLRTVSGSPLSSRSSHWALFEAQLGAVIGGHLVCGYQLLAGIVHVMAANDPAAILAASPSCGVE